MSTNAEPSISPRKFLVVLSLALLGWGGYHALGSYFGGFGGGNLQHDFRRSMVVFGCMSAFLGFWWILLLAQPAREQRTNRSSAAKKDGSSSAGSV